jgi:serine/threonine protein kinase
MDEISILSSLEHPNIVGFKDKRAYPEQRRIDIILEYVSGGSLQ